MRVLPLAVFVEPVTDAEWVLALRRAPIGTKVSDCDGDIWTKRKGWTDDGLAWLRTGGGWSSPERMVKYAPFFEYHGAGVEGSAA
ncbi:hypothetical protein IU451_28830 [Nocardia cyriacigeorgica]|uniref:hypothetical protein n=1 Tax=Nocardia cyriacigeorgica TaxID=135487 RepID=UPI0018934A8C|nr:hypothetical protein [Nocardia cyriacigeorgica]MBF6326508.1 hypothetical protein [Nocardia cyriacigeorgica]